MDGTIVQRAGGGRARVRLPGSPAGSRAARETNDPGSGVTITLSPGAGPPGRIDHPLDPGGWTRGRPPPAAPAVASTCLLPTRVRHRELLRAP